MSTTDTLRQVLERKRPNYDDERSWHRFLIDSYTGGGGYQGRIKQPAYGYWGAAAELYSQSSSHKAWHDMNRDTYLDRYIAEDSHKFNARIDLAHYPNYIAPLTDLKISFLLRKAFSSQNRPEKIEGWREDVDGNGTTFDEVRPDCILRAALTGWCPVLIDMDAAPVGEDGEPLILTRAQADEAGFRPRIIPLFPANLLEWALDLAGNFVWAKIRTDYTEHPDPFTDPVSVERYALWYPDHVRTYEIRRKNNEVQVDDLGERRHVFGRVPLAILRHAPDPDNKVQGLPMHGQVSIEARRLFNVLSEFDEHIRSQVFAILVYVAETLPSGGINLGVDNGLILNPDARNQHYFMAPPAGVADVFETRIFNSVREIYRQARHEFSGESGQAESGIARQLKFRATNRAIGDFAREVAKWEEDLHELVGRGLGIDEAEIAAEKITAPDNFDLADLNELVKQTIEFVTLKVGATATAQSKLRMIQEMLPNLDEDTWNRIRTEVEELSIDEARHAAFEREMLSSALGNVDDEGDNSDESGEDGEGQEAA